MVTQRRLKYMLKIGCLMRHKLSIYFMYDSVKPQITYIIKERENEWLWKQ